MALTVRTDLGDIKVELFCERTPRTCQNFMALCASDYYNGCLFHRNVKGFIVQTGDPTGTGKGGSSIWGRKFEDEFSEHLKCPRSGFHGQQRSQHKCLAVLLHLREAAASGHEVHCVWQVGLCCRPLTETGKENKERKKGPSGPVLGV
ncbi:peptidyl-prolyl cis-trans isomerase-like 3 isoform X2 [Rhinoraja longicauda]